MSFTIGRVGGPLPPASASTSTPLVDRLIQSAQNAEQLLKEGVDLTECSDEEILAFLHKTPIVPD